MQLDNDFFLRARARILALAVDSACQGQTLGVEKLSASLDLISVQHNNSRHLQCGLRALIHERMTCFS